MEISPKEKFFFNALAEFAAGSQEDGNIMLEFCKLIKKSNLSSSSKRTFDIFGV